MTQYFSDKQLDFIDNANKRWNLAHGPVSSGKTVGTLFRFLEECLGCPDSQIYMFGVSSSTVYENCIKLIFESPQFAIYRPFCVWQPGKQQLLIRDKVITIIGCKDEGSIGRIQGKTISICYCDEMSNYPDNIIQMIDTRLRQEWSRGFASMNPKQPTHRLKQWIDKAESGEGDYFSMQFMMEDNPFLPAGYVENMKHSLTGLFYKRNYLGLWCLAEGAVFDFWDRDIYVVDREPRAANYFIAGIDYGMSNPTACVLVGVNTGMEMQKGKQVWVQDEYYWNIKETGRPKVVSEFAKDIAEFLEPYGCRAIYVDPSALALKEDLRRLGVHTVDADNDVLKGIQRMTSDIRDGKCLVMGNCKILIREIEGYSWDIKAAERGEDKPVKKDDHLLDALRYCLNSHKVVEYQPYKHDPREYRENRFNPRGRGF